MLALAISTRSSGKILWNQTGSSHNQIVRQQGSRVCSKVYMCLTGSYTLTGLLMEGLGLLMDQTCQR